MSPARERLMNRRAVSTRADGNSASPPFIAAGGQRLSSFLKHRSLPAPAILDYAVEIAENLAELHQRGQAHGAVTPENAIVVRGTACLDRPASSLRATAADDIRQYAALVRALIEASDDRPGTDAAQVRALLEPIIRGYLRPEPQRAAGQMKKAVIALKLLRVSTPRAQSAPIAFSPVEPVIPGGDPKPSRRILLLVRRVQPPAALPQPAREVRPGLRYVLVLLGLAAATAAGGATALVHFWR